MSPHPLTYLRKAVHNLTYSNALYDMSLGSGPGKSHPKGLLFQPADPWPGDAQKGRWLCSGAFSIGDEYLESGDNWEPAGVEEAWLAHMHGFSWLRDLKALGGDQARMQARAMVQSWIKRYPRWDDMAWRADIMGVRLAAWIGLYDFFGATADEDFQQVFFTALTRQARHLSRVLVNQPSGLGALQAAKGLLYAGATLPDREDWINQALDTLVQETEHQILPDGAHISRSPEQLLAALMILLDARNVLKAAEFPAPPAVQNAINRMGPALRFFQDNDKQLAVFNGGRKCEAAMIDFALGQTGSKSKIPASLPAAGFERLSQGRAVVLFDNGKIPPAPYDKTAHAAPLSFSFSYNKERIFVPCGAHPINKDWQESLRATAAHNTLVIDNRNACEILTSGHFSRKIRNIAPMRDTTKDAVLAESVHDGYVSINGLTHRRRLFLSAQGHDLRGEDIVCSTIGRPAQPHEIAIRFHIHPRVTVSLVQNDTAALLRLPNGTGWRFQQAGGHLVLENSVYLGGSSNPRKTKQLVIYGQVIEEQSQFKWALQKER